MVAGCGAVACVGCMKGGVMEVVGAGRLWNMGVVEVVMVVGVAVTLGRSVTAVNDWGGRWWDVVGQRPLAELFSCDVMV